MTTVMIVMTATTTLRGSDVGGGGGGGSASKPKGKSVQEQVSELKEHKNICIVMDEVDGMSSGDYGGLRYINTILKAGTDVPVICIANDSYKVRTLTGHSLHFSWRAPSGKAVVDHLTKICEKGSL